jgi:D-tyrosyl-tRNA(Tyr) deacylase
MKAVIQRVTSAMVEIDGLVVGKISEGLLVLLGAANKDTETDVDYMVEKIPNLRIFPDETGKMNWSLKDVGGELLIVSQFTLLGDARRGRRPGFDQAASPTLAKQLYEFTIIKFREMGISVETGQFGANMSVSLKNNGPATFILDSCERG